MKNLPTYCRGKNSSRYLMVIIFAGLFFPERFRCAGLFGTDVKKLKESRNVQGLIHALQHKDPTVQYDAAEALGEIGDNRAIEPLLAALKNDETGGVRWKAAEALAKLGTPAAAGLISALQHDDDDVRWKAAIALGEIGDPQAIPPLINVMSDNDRFVRSRAAYALSLIGEPAVDPLIHALREGDGNLRWGAAIALGKIQTPRAIDPLIHALADKYENVRAESAAALAAIGKPALGPLLQVLKFSDGALRLEIVTALGELHDTGAIQPLIQLLDNADEDERKAIADALDEILVPAVKPMILRIRNGNLQTNKKKDKRVKTKEMDIVEDRSPPDAKIHRLITSLKDPSIDIRQQSVRALGSIGKPAVEPLIQALKEAVDNDHRWYIALALSRVGVPAIDPLILAMRVNPEKEFRRFAAAALGTIGVPAIDPIINAMASDDRELRGFLSLALCRIGKPAVEPLTRRLDDADDIIRSCATLTLWQMGETGLPAMLDTIEKEE